MGTSATASIPSTSMTSVSMTTMSMTSFFLLLSSLFLSCFSDPNYLLVETEDNPKQKKHQDHVSGDYGETCVGEDGKTRKPGETWWGGFDKGWCGCCGGSQCRCEDGKKDCRCDESRRECCPENLNN